MKRTIVGLLIAVTWRIISPAICTASGPTVSSLAGNTPADQICKHLNTLRGTTLPATTLASIQDYLRQPEMQPPKKLHFLNQGGYTAMVGAVPLKAREDALLAVIDPNNQLHVPLPNQSLQVSSYIRQTASAIAAYLDTLEQGLTTTDVVDPEIIVASMQRGWDRSQNPSNQQWWLKPGIERAQDRQEPRYRHTWLGEEPLTFHRFPRF